MTHTNNTIVVIDYGSGNLRSAAKAAAHVCKDQSLTKTVIISNDPEDVLRAERLILPGQGAFGDCMAGLSNIDGMVEALNEAVLKQAKPFLGICVGMQLMATEGLEHGQNAGLNWVPGQVIPFNIDQNLKIPHMGWNGVVSKFTNRKDNISFVLRSIESAKETPKHYYFVHSFVFDCKDKTNVLATCDYGGEFPAIVGRENMIGVQFHPEKSQDAGLRLMSDFVCWAP